MSGRERGGLASAVLSLWSVSDEEAMLRVQVHNDPRAFDLLMRRWQGPIVRLCTRMTGDGHLAEDLTQETFMRLLANAASYRGAARFSSFIWRIALNLCCDERRRAGRRAARLPGAEAANPGADPATLESQDVGPAAVAAGRERSQIVQDALGELPEHYRSVVVLRHYEGLKFREIADVLDVPEGTVKSRMAKALDRLGRALGPSLGGERTAEPTIEGGNEQIS